MAYGSLGELLRERFDRRFSTQESFRRVLTGHYGIEVSPQALSTWLNGQRYPGRGKLVAILDALDIHGVDRDAAWRLYDGHPANGDASDGEAA